MSGQGIWYILSKKDPRWTAEGRGLVGVFETKDREQKIEELKNLYGDPPDDLEWGFVKT